MAVSDPEGRAMDTKAPLTPPSDRMDIDSHGKTLQNGHPLKDPSLVKAASLEDSFQNTPSDNLKSYLQNNAVTAEGTPDASQPDTSQETADLHLPASSEADLISTAFTSSAQEQAGDQATVTDDAADTDITALNSTVIPVQAPTSDLREEPQPATSQQSTEIKEQKREQDLLHDPELANGLTNPKPEQIEAEPSQSNSLPEAVTVSQFDIVSLPDEDQMDTQTNGEPPASIESADIPHHPPVPVPEGAEVEAPIDPAPSPAPDEKTSPAQGDVSKSLSEVSQASPTTESLPAPPADHSMEEQTAQTDSIQEAKPDDSTDSADQIMQDAPPSPAKVARPREEDDVDAQPAVKRPRTDGEAITEPDFKKPERPEISTDVNGTSTDVKDKSPSSTRPDFAHPVTQPQHKHLLRILGALKRLKDANPFLHPVDPVALGIPTYPTVITNPMDLGTLEENEKKQLYPTINAFVSDFNQIVWNSEKFNNHDHPITQMAHRMQTSFWKQMEKLPGRDVPEPARADKKKKAPVPASEKPVAPRRESRSSLPGTAPSPIAPATPTFALGPQGLPVIRRDSTLNAERPKREIHPPASRDLPYTHQKPKKKKYQMELKFCQHVLDEITKPRHRKYADPFLQKVDPVALNIPTYFNIIKQPMAFDLIQQKLSHGEYENAKEFDLDGRLVFANCFKFNPPNTHVNELGKQLEDVYNRVWKEKNSWIEKQTPASGPTSAGTTPEGSEDEEDDDEEEDDGQNEILKLQQQIAAMSKQVELITQKKKSPPVASKKAKSAAKPEKKSHKKAAPAPPAKAKASRPAAKSGAASKAPYVTYEQKQDISNRINSLPEAKMGQALAIIRDNMPKLKGVEDDELELDIDELDNDVLYQLLQFVRRHAPKSEDPVRSKPPPAPATTTTSRKKNKPMSKMEQETRIQQVKGSLSAFDNPGPASFAAGADSSAIQEERDTSGDEEDSEESEEE